MRQVLITGAGGFIGSHTVQTFLEQGCFVHALVHKHVPQHLQKLADENAIRLIYCDIRKKEQLTKVFKNLPQLDALVHCAAKASDTGRKKDFIATNYTAVKYIVELTKKYRVKRLVFVSTTDVYGMHDFAGETEQELAFDLQATNPYPKYKILSEQWIQQELPPEQYSIIRPAAVWGENDTTLTQRVKDFLGWSPWIIHFGPWKGKNRWPLAHVKTVALANYLGAFHPEAIGKSIQVLDPGKTSIDEFYWQVATSTYPQKKYKTLCLPLWLGLAFGALSTCLSNLCNTKKPIFDPTFYAVLSISHNLDFSSTFFEKLKETRDLAK